ARETHRTARRGDAALSVCAGDRARESGSQGRRDQVGDRREAAGAGAWTGRARGRHRTRTRVVEMSAAASPVGSVSLVGSGACFAASMLLALSTIAGHARAAPQAIFAARASATGLVLPHGDGATGRQSLRGDR